MIWQNREIKHILFPFRIQWDTSSWPGNCTEISGASSSLKHIEIGPWLEGYWFKPLTPPTPWREEWTSSALPFSPANAEVPLSKAINYYVLKWNDSVADFRRQSLCSQMWMHAVLHIAVKQAGSEKGCACSLRLLPEKVKDLKYLYSSGEILWQVEITWAAPNDVISLQWV